MNNKQIKKIQVPYNLIAEKSTPHNATYLYVNLRMICVNNHVKIYIEKLKEYLHWQDTRTIKKYLEWLKKNKYIEYNFKSIPKHIPIELDIIPTKKYFVQVSINTIKKIILTTQEIELDNTKKDLKEMAVKLYYYYTKLYNIKIGKACPTYEEIYKDTGISSKYIRAINKVLKKNKILKIKEGDWYQYEISENIYKPRKERNSYVPLE